MPIDVHRFLQGHSLDLIFNKVVARVQHLINCGQEIWDRYYDNYHAVAYVIDTQERERLGEG
ncbi:hypothetical protein JVT61DRAFT_6680 [Boletus reticuloceps]|uniref:Uncharacterized protein n=1 Tax=Boletus reticuloceps TaxID=495285 RepID=A0A8I3A6E9_9AGAM|nr:hypothetical protein JVT61DRAFT_6680 [Boletus reticuloceps]